MRSWRYGGDAAKAGAPAYAEFDSSCRDLSPCVRGADDPLARLKDAHPQPRRTACW